ncbi:hypothetical protein [Actinomadura sp. 6N118]|uniref:hypothetical protein n=1 Tax=Actinomadura sp. 6N118 TaxID=3375151 RepID=UPI0037B425D5
MIATWFPTNASYDQLKRLAELHALDVDFAYDRIGASNNVPTDRLIVNYLRHECTDYDEDQTSERHRAACEAIAKRYPCLAEECQRQIKRRHDKDEEIAAMVASYEIEKEQERAERRARVEASKRIIAGLRVGQKVMYKNRRYTYEATVTKIGRSKVTVAYQVKTGKDRDRTATVHAAFVTPVEAA